MVIFKPSSENGGGSKAFHVPSSKLRRVVMRLRLDRTESVHTYDLQASYYFSVTRAREIMDIDPPWRLVPST